MARARTIVLPLLLLAAAVLCAVSLLPGAFVGPYSAASSRMTVVTEGGLRAPAVAMEARGGAEGEKSDGDLPQVLTVLFFFSLAANYAGFFNSN
mmetsp:Transcript_56183/g.146485  ORF Transcript_56183/g.146485 Transcript_56183/m.146485 type:complete len:94 (-) Transcript_56183:195-476(-)